MTNRFEKEGSGIESASIGPAGENGVLFANIMCSGGRLSAAGRAGIGAVLGSKNCKAVVARGERDVTVADQDKLAAFQKALLATLREKAKALTNLGTPVLVNMINSAGKLATHNNTRETFEHAHDISGEVIAEKYFIPFIHKRISSSASFHFKFAGQTNYFHFFLLLSYLHKQL